MDTAVDLFSQLNSSVQAEFRSSRDTIPAWLVYADDAPAEFARLLRAELEGDRALVLSDARTLRAAGGECPAALVARGFSVTHATIPDDANGHSPVCDDVTFARQLRELPAADVIVAVGSGVINDLSKWIASVRGIPYAVVATAASMNGYAAANVAPAIAGVKSLFRARAPRIIAAKPSVIEQAPWELTASGLGDVVAKPVSTADWRMNNLLFDEAYSPAVAAIISDVEPLYVDAPDALRARDPRSIRGLFEALIYSGAAMTLMGSSLPASGGEHLVSHTLDMMSHAEGTTHDLHGRQVGVATIFAAAVYERVLALGEKPAFRAASIPFDARVWGPIAPAVETEWQKKTARIAEACVRLPERWGEIRKAIAPLLRSSASVRRCLERAGAAYRVQDIGCTRERFLRAVTHCAAMRGRFTSIDLGYVTGVLPDAAPEIIDELLGAE